METSGAEMSPKSYCKHQRVSTVEQGAYNQPIKRTFGGVMSYVAGSGADWS